MRDTGQGLAERLAGSHEGWLDGAALVDEFRRALVLVPLSGEAVWSADTGGVRWLYAFTCEESLRRFLVARGIGPDTEVPYMRVFGARLLDVAVPAVGVPAGIAVDVAGPWPGLLPPVAGIVPPAAVAA
ncbi:SseB family protein [Streptomyces guryensis]|uniref:SseB family protein n=1 Tax=Streptomyces guryensis TaxID=2886947 RepID=A0A9Q3ZBW2_9ACTN|nr:SseB family protein [Streptomyces guryensis]MCD9880739.1 SseB family protein [Streptomyces guryensis]